MRMHIAAGILCSWTTVAAGQVVNGDFEGGSLKPWVIAGTGNGQTLVQDLVPYDIDGPGPLPISTALQLQVGQIGFVPGVQEGVKVTQMVPLHAGVDYTLAFAWAVQRDIMVNDGDGGEFSIIVNGNVLQTVAAGPVSGTTPIFGAVHANFVPAATGLHAVGFRVTRRFLPAEALFQYVDGYRVDGCYPDCNRDGVLNVADFGCFRAKLALKDPYVDCNGDGILNVADFGCFLTKFALGCP